jgi:hypothetical protein
MSREQLQVPFGDKGEETDQEKEARPKGLNRPLLPKGLEKPKVKVKAKTKTLLRRQCSGCSDPRCDAPSFTSEFFWTYYDANTGQRVLDPDLPRNGP